MFDPSQRQKQKMHGKAACKSPFGACTSRLALIALIVAMLAIPTQACYGVYRACYSGCHNYSWSHGYGYQWYNWSKTAELSDQTYTSIDSTLTVTPSKTNDCQFYCNCGTVATLYFWDEKYNNNEWVNVSTNYGSAIINNQGTISWVTGFDQTHGILSIYSADLKHLAPSETVRFKINIYDSGSNGGTNADYEFDVTVHNACYYNSLSEGATPSDTVYNILENGSTGSVAIYGTVTGNKSSTNCPLTREMQIWDDTNGDFITFSSSTYPWGTALLQAGSNRMRFTLLSQDYAGLGSGSIEAVYHLRVKTYDPEQESDADTIYQAFDVNFTSECQNDGFTLSGIGKQSFQLGASDTSISLGMSYSHTYCPYTTSHYYWNNSTSAWDAFSSAPFRVAEADNSITIGVSGSHTAYEPEIYYQIKVVWVQTQSDLTEGYTEEFQIRFYDPCFDNQLSISTQLSDVTYQVHPSTTGVYNPSIGQTVSIGTCPYVATCEIYDDSTDSYVGCNTSTYSQFFSSFSSSNGQYVVLYTTTDWLNDYSAPYDYLVYQVRITFVDDQSVTAENTISDTFTLTIKYQCALDEITLESGNTDIGESTIYIGGSSINRLIEFTQSQASCTLEYGLQFFNEDTDTWDIYSSESWVTSFSTSTGDVVFAAANDSNFVGMKPSAEKRVALTVTSTGSVQTTATLEDTFTLVIIDECVLNVLTATSTPSDVAFLIQDDGSTPDNVQYATVTGDVGEARCPLTRTVEIWDDTNGAFIDFNTGTHTWANYVDDSASTSRVQFTVDTEDWATLDNASIEETLYHMRITTEDPYSNDTTNPQQMTFDVSFNYECQSDYFTLSGVSEQSFYLGQSAYTISLGMTQQQTNCADTYNIYYFNNNTSEWDDISNADFHQSDTDNSLVISVASSSYSSYKPEVWYRIKVDWVSTYSEVTAGLATEEFKIQFYDPCVDNYLTIDTELEDVIYQVSNSVYGTYTPQFTAQVSTATCPLTATCEIYNEINDIWVDCNYSTAMPHTTKYQKASHFFSSFVTANTGVYRVIYTVADYQTDWSAPYPDEDYLVRITIGDPLSLHADAYISDTFTLTIQFKCALDTLTTASSAVNIAHTQLTIDYTTNVLKALDFTQLYAECPLTFGLELWNDDYLRWDTYTSEPYVESFNTATTTYSNYGVTAGIGQLYLGAISLSTSTYDMDPWFNVTAKLFVTSDYSVQEDNYIADEFVISIVEKCRMVNLDATMGVTSGGLGVFGNPYLIDMWQQLDIPVTRSTYDSPYTDPHSYTRCDVKTTLHYNDVHLTPVSTAKWEVDSSSYVSLLELQWDYGTFDDFFVIVIQVIYDDGGKEEVIVNDEQRVYVKISNPCLITSGGAIIPKAISDIQYWIKDSVSGTSVTYFEDAPTVRDGLQTYIYQNPDDLCGQKSYEIIMTDQITSNTDTAFLNLANTGSPMSINVVTIDPQYYTNAYVTYYLKVTLDDYVDDYGDDEATYFESFRLDMMNCQVTSFNKDSDGALTYILYTPVEKFPYTEWTDNAQSSYIRTGANCMDNGYVLDYSVKWRDFYDTTLEIPTMINWKFPSVSLHSFWVYSDDTVMVEYDRIEFVIELTASTNILDMDPIYTEVYTLTVTVLNTCPTDTLSLDSSYPHSFVDYTYYIGENTDTPSFSYSAVKPKDHQLFNANWDTTIPYCPLDFEILRDYSATGTASSYEAFTSSEGSAVTLINPMVITVPGTQWTNSIATHQLTWEEQFLVGPYYYDMPQITLKIQTSDYSFLLDDNGDYQDEVVWWLAVNRVSSKSDVDNSASRIYFKLTMADVCHDIPLTASEPHTGGADFTQVVYLFDLFTIAHQNYQIENGHSWPSVTTYCGGGFTHYLIYESLTDGIIPDGIATQARSSVYVANDVETLFGIEVDGAAFDNSGAGVLLTDLEWVGQHSSDEIGIHVFYIRTYIGKVGGSRQGMYESHYIDSTYTVTLNVKNPCNTAQLVIPSLTKSTDGTEIEILEAREWGGQVILQYEMPYTIYSDSLVDLHENIAGKDKYDLCGPLNHYITLEDGSVLIGLQSTANNFKGAHWLEFQYYPDGDPDDVTNNYPPVYQLRINSTSQEDWGAHILTLHFDYVNYPLHKSVDEEWLVNAQIEYCLVESWDAPANFPVVFTVGQKPISVEYIYQQFPCTYGATYSVKLVEISGVTQSDTTPPAFINQDDRSGFMTVYTNDYDDLGWYVLEITATLDHIELLGDLDELNNLPAENYPDDPDSIFLNTRLYDLGTTFDSKLKQPIEADLIHPKLYGAESPPDDFIYQTSFNITMGIIQVNESSITDNNTAPYLLPKPIKEHKIIVGQAWEYDVGRAFDWENDNVSVYMDLKNAAQFFTFDYETMILSIAAGQTNQQTQPIFDCKLTLSDDNEFDSLSKTYDFVLVMVKDYRDPIFQVIEQARKEEVIFNYEGRVYDLTETSIDEVTKTQSSADELLVPDYKLGLAQIDLEQLKLEEDLDEILNPKPAPVIESFSSDGICKIRFNTPMKIPDLTSLLDSRVALRLTQAVSQNEISTEKYLTDDGYSDFQIRNAIEVNMAPSDTTEDPIKVDYTWQIISFTEYVAEIQLIFDFPESVSSSSSDPDNVVITFWAGDLFQAANGKSVRAGLTITAPVTRQVSIDNAKYYRDTGRYTGYAILGGLILGFLAALNLNADTVPIWATYDTLVLITHLPLLNIMIPGRTSILLSEIAKVLRLSFEPMRDWFKGMDVGNSAQPLTNILMQNGYDSTSIIINLASILAIFILLLIALMLAKCIDCSYVTNLKQPNPNGRTYTRSLSATQKITSMMFKLLLVFFLEIFICLLINFKGETNGKNDFESTSRVVSITMLAIMSCLILLMFMITAIESDPERDEKQLPAASLNSFYQGMSLKRRTSANIYLISQMLRRAVYAVVVIMMQDYPSLQIMILLVTSSLLTMILMRGRPYDTQLSKWSLFFFEFIFAWTCALCMMFSAEYMHRSYTVASDMANAICILAGCITIFGLVLLTYSLCWQIKFNMNRKQNMELAAELARRPKRIPIKMRSKPAAAPMEPVPEDDPEDEESYRMNPGIKRAMQKQRKIDSMINLQSQGLSVTMNDVEPSATKNQDDNYMLDNEDDGLNQLEKLAGIDKNATGVGQNDLVISDDEFPDQEQLVSEERANSVGAESSYSDFMQQWKNKLDGQEVYAGPSDLVSSHSRRSNNSAREDTPFRNITAQQTSKLLKGQKQEVIPEQQYEESEDSDIDNSQVLSKVERRRLNLLSSRNDSSQVLPDYSVIPVYQAPAIQEEHEDDDFELL